MSNVLFAVMLFAGAALAQPADPLKSAPCLQALAALHAQEAAIVAGAQRGKTASASAAETMAHLASLRQAAARLCLGTRADAPAAAGRVAQPPIVVPPVGHPLPARTPPAAAPPPVQTRPLTSVTGCDALGCWASDGTRLQRVGPNLLGPAGLCSVQGSVLHCP